MSRFLLVLFAVCGALVAAPARAETVLLACAEECSPALFEALELELRGHGGVLVARPALAGFTPGARAADAQRLSQLLRAAATLWVEHEAPLRLRSYAATSGQVQDAPLSAEVSTLEPKVFAAVAGSLVLEALSAQAPVAATQAPTPPPAAAATTAPTIVHATSVSASDLRARQQLDQWSPMEKPTPRMKRFFVRAGLATGFAWIQRGTKIGRLPSADLVQEASRDYRSDVDSIKGHLESKGYDCDVTSMDDLGGSSAILVSKCTAKLRHGRAVGTAAIDFALGMNVTPRVALALTLRVDPSAGSDTLANLLAGLQTEIGLLRPKPTGFWLSALAGFGVGQIRVRPPATSTTWLPSGLGNARAGLMLGYRFLPSFGVVASPTAHYMFPDSLFALESNINLEVRL